MEGCKGHTGEQVERVDKEQWEIGEGEKEKR